MMNTHEINTFLLFKLPAAFVCGVRARKVGADSAVVTAPTKWISKNPFGSMYFAVQAMAAELSTGILLMRAIRRSGRPASMLVTGLRAEYFKKAVGRITFICFDGEAVAQTVELALSGQSQIVELTSTGKDQAGDVVSVHTISWSIKSKQPLNSP